MTQKNTRRGLTQSCYPKGFTLIELLVAVLIIGILAAIAVPQYQKAVEKSRATEALSMLKSVFQAANAYYLANGSWPTQFNQLDTDIPWTGTKQWYYLGHHKDYRSNKNWSIQILNSGDLGQAIVIGRISGNYKGAGFRMYHTKPSSGYYNFRTNYPICIETGNNSSVAIPFSNEQDSYCAKILHGTFISTPSADRMYILP